MKKEIEIPEVFSVNTIEVEGDFGIVCNDNGSISISLSKEESKREFDEMRDEYVARGGTWPNSFALMRLSFPMKAIDIAQSDLIKLLPETMSVKRVRNVSGSRVYVVAEKAKFVKYLENGIVM